MNNKSFLFLIIMLLLGGSQIGCKKFLQVTPIDKLSGNVYWQSRTDVEDFVNDIYGQLNAKLMSAPFVAATGELRSGEIKPTIGVSFPTNFPTFYAVYNNFSVNDMKGVVNTDKNAAPWNNLSITSNQYMYAYFNYQNITKWTEFYTGIQGANILFYKIDKGVPGLSSDDNNRYKAEAVFIRCLCYFLMVRIYGDVAYYTDAYHSTPIARENFVSVLNKCITELNQYKEFLPWTYPDPGFNGVRANRGGAISLLMNMNMWNAGFDQANKTQYYQATADLGAEIVNSGQYQLLPLNIFNTVMIGHTAEGLIEFKDGVNNGNTPNRFAFPGQIMLAVPHKVYDSNAYGVNGQFSNGFYKTGYLTSIYTDPSDKRITTWFNSFTVQDGSFELLKFIGEIGANGYPDWGLILFRYGDAVLLRAEALAELDKDAEATAMLNIIRQRAGASTYPNPAGSDTNLKDAIFIERSRELIGEGYHYFDLIRTRRILNPAWTSDPLTQGQFDAGAWTWPIDASALLRNPLATLNNYWVY